MFEEGETLKSLVIPDGQNAVFQCKMESLRDEQPPTDPIWKLNGKELFHKQCEFSYLFIHRTSYLLIYNDKEWKMHLIHI